MKSRPVSLLILIAFAFGCMYLLDSCRSSKHSASYPVIHKLKHEKFAEHINPKNKIKNTGKSHILVQTNENKTIDAAFSKNNQNEVQIISEKSSSNQSYVADSGPDIASLNNDIIYTNYSTKIDNQFFNAYFHNDKNSNKSYRYKFFLKKPDNHSEFERSDLRRGNDSPAFGIVALVLGILGLFVPVGLAIVFGIVAAVFGALGANKKLKGLAIAGLILGLICILFGLMLL